MTITTWYLEMTSQDFGGAIRAARIRRRLRQTEVAQRAGVSQSLVSLVERGHLDRLSLTALRRVAAVLDVRLDVSARWRGGELDRLVNARALRARRGRCTQFCGQPGWQLAPEVSFNVYGERGVIDVFAWHAVDRSLLAIELKTAIVDVQELVGTMDRKVRWRRGTAARAWLARAIGERHG